MGSGECFPWFIRPSDSNGVTLFLVTQDPSLQPQTVQLRQIATENIGLVLGGAGPKDSNDWMTHGLLLVQSTGGVDCVLCSRLSLGLYLTKLSSTLTPASIVQVH